MHLPRWDKVHLHRRNLARRFDGAARQDQELLRFPKQNHCHYWLPHPCFGNCWFCNKVSYKKECNEAMDIFHSFEFDLSIALLHFFRMASRLALNCGCPRLMTKDGVLVEHCDLDQSCNLDQQIFKGIFVRNLRWRLKVQRISNTTLYISIQVSHWQAGRGEWGGEESLQGFPEKKRSLREEECDVQPEHHLKHQQHEQQLPHCLHGRISLLPCIRCSYSHTKFEEVVKLNNCHQLLRNLVWTLQTPLISLVYPAS